MVMTSRGNRRRDLQKSAASFFFLSGGSQKQGAKLRSYAQRRTAACRFVVYLQTWQKRNPRLPLTLNIEWNRQPHTHTLSMRPINLQPGTMSAMKGSREATTLKVSETSKQDSESQGNIDVIPTIKSREPNGKSLLRGNPSATPPP